MNCIFEHVALRADGRHDHRCRLCGQIRNSRWNDPAKVHAACLSNPETIAKVFNLTDSEVAARLAICRACPEGHFHPDGYCKICPSCRSLAKDNFDRRLRDPRARCPLKLWPRPIYVNLDPIGWGDLAIFAYIALGTRNTKTPLVICATGEKARHVRLLGLEPDDPAKDPTKWTAFTAEMEHFHAGGTLGRLEFYADHYGVERRFQRPDLHIPEEDLAFARSLGIDRRTVLFFPDSLSPNRVWPKNYWNELDDLLGQHGLRSFALPIRGFEKHKNAVDARPMVRAAACMKLAGLGIGNDSALINWTPLVDLPALCLLGPTRKEIFQHAPLIRCLTPRTPLPYNATPDHPAGGDCNGCCYHFKHNPFCSQTCMSLANMLPAEVAEEAVTYHREVWG
jgi:hypothetical protein